MACCETKIGEMDTLRNRLPKTIAKYGEQEFSDDEIRHIRMLVPLCITCHGKMLKEEYLDTPYEETTYRKYFTDLINNEYGGRCYD
jgi:cytochrome c553